jgi:hypothetical protein
VADKSIIQTSGGQYSVQVAAGTLVNTPAYIGGGRICRASITTLGSVDLQLWDSATTTGAAGATLVGNITGAAPVGTVIDLQIPVTTGILPLQITNTPGLALSYSKDTVYGL